MKKTNIYNFGYLEAGDQTSEFLDLDQKRFLAIENNIQHLYSIFGNGVIVETGAISTASWDIRNSGDTNKAQIFITPGEGHVGWKYSKTSQNVTIDLPITTSAFPIKFWIYAIANDTTPELGTVTFIPSLIEINDPINYVGIGAVTVNQTNDLKYDLTISDDGRVVINLFETLASRVNAHKHVGGSKNPSPIDLSSHVQGKLSGDFISDLDASKITKGVLSVERLPQISHDSLSRTGTLSHNEIDSLLADLKNPTGSTLSDLFIVNLLQLAMSLKKQNGLGQIDKNLVNIIMYQPGYNNINGTLDDSFVAFYSNFNTVTSRTPIPLTGVVAPFVPEGISLAKIDKGTHQIVGGAPTASINDNIFWKTDVDFKREFRKTETLPNNQNSRNIEILGAGEPAYIVLDKPVNFNVLSEPELSPDKLASRGWTFARTTIFRGQSATPQYEIFTYDFKLFLNSNQSITPIDFNGISKVAFSYKVVDADRDVYAYFILRTGGTLVDFTAGNNQTNNVQKINKTPDVLLYTANANKTEEDIKYFEASDFFVGISLAQKSEVIGFGFRWENDDNTKLTLIDADQNVNSSKLSQPPLTVAQAARNSNLAFASSAVFAWNDKLYNRTGQLIIRFNDASGNSKFSNLYAEKFDDGVNGASVKFSTRVANTVNDLNNTAFTNVNSELVISSSNNTGNWIDIKVLLESSTDRLLSPIVDTVGLTYNRPGEATQKKWDTVYEFTNQGLLFNNVQTLINEDPFGVGVTLTGQVFATEGNKTVTGTSTDFQGQLNPGDYIYKGTNQVLGVVDEVISSTELTLVTGSAFDNSGNPPPVVKKAVDNTDYLQIVDTSQVGNFQFLKFNTNGHAFFYRANKQSQTETVIYAGINSSPATGGAYTTPYQAWQRARESGLERARDATILINKNAVIADTLNDRIIEVTENGNFVRAIQGNVRLKRNARDFVALTAYYNDTTNVLYICFSQYMRIVDKAKISIRYTDQIITLDTSGITCELFSPVTWDTGAGNGDNLAGGTSWSGSRSATIQATFTSATLQAQIASWPRNSVTVVIASGAVAWVGNDGIPYSSTTNNDTTNYGNELPKYLREPYPLFKNVGGNGEFQSDKFVAFRGFKTQVVTRLEGDFNGDNVLPSATSAPLYGPDGLEAPVTLKVFVGNVVMDNLFSPISIQVLSDDQWLVAACGAYTVNIYNSSGTNLTNYQISTSQVKFKEGKGGSAYLLSRDFVLVAAPAQTGVDGAVKVIAFNSSRTVKDNLLTPGLDAVRAIPDPDGLHYWVALDDAVTNGLNSKLVKMDTSGNIRLEWGSGERDLSRPVGLAFTDNGDILISE